MSNAKCKGSCAISSQEEICNERRYGTNVSFRLLRMSNLIYADLGIDPAAVIFHD